MKSLLLSAFILFSSNVFSSEKKFECSARYVFGVKKSASITGTMTSETSLADVTYSIDDQVEFSAGLVTKARVDSAPRYAFYQQFKISGGNHTLYMPDSMDNMDHFTAIVGNTKTFEKLECFVEN